MQLRSATPVSGRDEDSVYLTSDSLHDLSSPINQICSLSDLILRNYKEAPFDQDAKALFGFLQTSASRLQNLLAGLRVYMQVAGPPPACRQTEGDVLLKGALAMLQHQISESDAAVTHDTLPELWCDPSQITYVLACLIDNSIKFHGEARPEIHVGSVPDQDTWVLSVRDNGMGIPARYASRIFSAFKRLHNDTYPGSGIGLAIAKRVIERHGGQIWVESELGHGATFYLQLPKVEEQSTNAEDAAA